MAKRKNEKGNGKNGLDKLRRYMRERNVNNWFARRNNINDGKQTPKNQNALRKVHWMQTELFRRVRAFKGNGLVQHEQTKGEKNSSDQKAFGIKKLHAVPQVIGVWVTPASKGAGVKFQTSKVIILIPNEICYLYIKYLNSQKITFGSFQHAIEHSAYLIVGRKRRVQSLNAVMMLPNRPFFFVQSIFKLVQ